MRRLTSKRIVLIAGLALLAFFAFSMVAARNRVPPPIHNGQPLTYWAKKHPSDYYSAVRALGTNALPYLIGELHARDSAPARLIQHAIGSVISIGEIFTRARHRRYYARLGLQQLETNAVPVLLDLFVREVSNRSAPIARENFDVAWALSWIGSPEADSMKLARFVPMLTSDEPGDKVLGCNGLTHTLASPPPASVTIEVVRLASDPNERVRQCAMIFFSYQRNAEDLSLPVLVRSVTDTNDIVRRFAFNALQYRGTNATSALPALLTVYSNIPASSIRDEVRYTINQIQPAVRLP